MESMIGSDVFWSICVILSGVRICGNIQMEFGNKHGIVLGPCKTAEYIEQFLSKNLST